MKIRHHENSAHALMPGMEGTPGCEQCESDAARGKFILITDSVVKPEGANTGFVVWLRNDGLVSASAGWEMPKDFGPWTFQILLTTSDWEGCTMRIRAERTAAVMNHDLSPIRKTAQANLLGVMI
jgi:hypothetical protein